VSPLTIFFDTYSAPSWLALRPTLELLDELAVKARWMPFRAPVERRHPPQTDKQPDEDVRRRHQRVRQDYRDHDHARYAARQGRSFLPPAGTGDRDLIDYGLLEAGARGRAPVFLERLTMLLWGGDEASVDSAWLSATLGVADLRLDWALVGAQRLAAARDEAASLGIFDAPTFLIGDELFIGRAHLPAIRRLLIHGTLFPASGS